MGMLVFSPFSSLLLINWLHFPFSMPELLFIPFFCFLRYKKIIFSIDKIDFVKLFTCWVLLLGISFLVSEYSYIQLLSSSRSYLYLILFYSIFKKTDSFTIDELIYVILGSIVAWTFCSFYNLQISKVNDNFLGVSYGALLTIPLFISYFLCKRNVSIFFIGSLSLLLLSFTSGLRRQILVTVLSVFFSLFFSMKKSLKHSVSFFIVLFFFSFVLIYYWDTAEGYIKNEYPLLYYRVFSKTELFLSGEGSVGDQTRTANFDYLYHHIGDYCFPKGFVSKQFGGDEKLGIFNDFPLLELFYLLSFPITIILIIYWIFVFYKCTKAALRGREGAIMFSISFLILMCLLFLEGSFLTHPYATPITGYCLGRLYYYSK